MDESSPSDCLYLDDLQVGQPSTSACVVQSGAQRSPDFRCYSGLCRLDDCSIFFTTVDASRRHPAVRKFFLLRYRRNYDRTIAGLGTGKAQRYFASDLDRLSSRLFDANGIEAVEVAVRVSHGSVQQRGTARAQPVQQCSTGSNKISKGELHQEAGIDSTS